MSALAVLHPVDGERQALDVPGGGVQHRQAHHVGLDAEPHLDQLEGLVSSAMSSGIALGAEIDEGAAADPPGDQALDLELVERGADRGARGAEGGGELALRRQLFAMGIAALDDRLAQLARDPGRAAHRIRDDRDRPFGDASTNFSHFRAFAKNWFEIG